VQKNVILPLMLLFISGGCGRSNDAAVSGQVTLDGNPMHQGMVVYHPEGEGTVAYGRIDETGYYEVKTGQVTGLQPGGYVVTIVATEGVVDPAAAGNRPPSPGRIVTPEKYCNKATSPLRQAVTSGSNEIDFSLESP